MAELLEFDLASGATPMVAAGTLFLPVSGAWACFAPGVAEPQVILVPAGALVHSLSAGRVVRAGDAAAGEVVVRGLDEITAHYRRIRPSSVTVREGDRVEAGQVLGATGGSDSDPGFLFGMQDAEGTWLEPGVVLCGAADPDELMISPTALAPPTESRRNSTRIAGAVASERAMRVVAPSDPEPERAAPAATRRGVGPNSLAGSRRHRSGTRPADERKAPQATVDDAPTGSEPDAKAPDPPEPVPPDPAAGEDDRVSNLVARRKRKRQ